MLALVSGLKGAFQDAQKSSSSVTEAVDKQPAKKKLKLVGVQCNAASGCSSRSIHKDPGSKTMYCKEHYEMLPKTYEKTLVSMRG